MILDKNSNCLIVIEDDYDKPLYKAASELKNIIKKITDCKIYIIKQCEYREISNECVIKIFSDFSIFTHQRNSADGYITIIDNNTISICGASKEGTRNGVYGFIEDELGCMFLTPDYTYIPRKNKIFLQEKDTVNIPETQWRDVYSYDVIKDNWAAKLRLNGVDVYEDSKTGEDKQYYKWGTWCHSCYDFLSPDDYFDSHPEYFSQFHGKRVHKYKNIDAYLCLSNPEVFEIVKNNLAKKMENHPEQIYWDFSGSDNPFIKGCQCAKCRKADREAGGTGMGTLLPFLNKLARAFPDKYISTLAYTHTLKAPKNIKAEPNVVIKLCSMPGDQSSSYLYGNNKRSGQFKKQVEQWSEITDKIVVWDYVVDFKHLLLPFPNFRVQADNQRFYENNKLIGIFHQASRENGGELSCLRAYVLSHLMWEGSRMNVSECIEKYVNAYYEAAAPEVSEYLKLTDERLYASGKPLGLYDGILPHIKGYLSKDSLEEYLNIINRAKMKVHGNKTIEDRLECIELSIVYASMLNPNIGKDKRDQFFERYKELCKKQNITMVTEWDSFDKFNNKIYKLTLLKSKFQYLLRYGLC